MLVIPNMRWNSKDLSTDWTIWPTSLCVFSAILEPNYDITIIDANMDNLSEDEFSKKVKSINPIAVGVSIFADDFCESGHKVAKLIKLIDNNISVIAGGNYVIINPDVATKDKNIDYFVIGEGEYVLKELLDHVSQKTDKLPLKGILYRKDGIIINTGKAELIENLDALPFPDYSKIDFAKYANHENRQSAYKPDAFPYGRIITSRGCPFDCCFCQNKAIHGKKIRYRKPEIVLDEIENLVKNYHIKSLLIDDANFTVDRKRTKAILQGFLERKFNIQWKAMNLAVFTLNDELLELMRKSGCSSIDLALESGVPRVLKEIIHKPVKLAQVRQVIKKAKELNFQISANFIIGFPGETWNEIRQTINFADELDVDYVKIMVAMPLRHTELYDMAFSGGYLRDDFDFFKMRWGSGEIQTEEFTTIDTTILRVYEWDRINFSSEEKIDRVCKIMGCTRQEITKIRLDTRKKLTDNLIIHNKWKNE